MANRICGGCTLCCKLLPVSEIDKPGYQRCQHQRHGKGCAIYPTRPFSCRFWSCAWLIDERTADLSRPDRSHYVIDQELDFVVAVDNATGESQKLPVIQVWLDPKHPDAHRDPALRAYLDARRVPGLIRTSVEDAFLILPPSITKGAGWIENPTSTSTGTEHTQAEREEAFREMRGGAA
jgi:hypothetical protein